MTHHEESHETPHEDPREAARDDQRAPTPLAGALQAARRRSFVGRERELAIFRAALDDADRPLTVLYVTGPGGIGKSALLRRFAQEATEDGRKVVALDARTAECTPDAFLADAAKALSQSGTVLLIDTFERYRPLEAWLREEFLPRMPLGTIAVLGGRERPAPEWRKDPAWNDILQVLDVGELLDEDAVALLTSRHVPPARHDAVVGFAGGHPLALSLAAETAVLGADSDDAADAWTPSHDVIGSLVARLVGDVPSLKHRQALDVCALAHLTTETLLRAVLSNPDTDTGSLFTWLRGLPFVESGPHGIYPHDVVREILDADLRWRDPERHRTACDQILVHINDRLQSLRDSTDPADRSIARYLCANALHLQRDGFGRSALYDGRRAGDVYEDTLRPGDRTALLELTEQQDSAQLAHIIEYWLDRQPEAFFICRDARTHGVAGFMACIKLTESRREDTDADPLVAEAWAHIERTAPLRPGEHITFVHSACPATDPRPIAHLLGASLMAQLLTSARLAWSITVIKDFETYHRNPYNTEQLRADDAVQVGGQPYWLFRTDRRVHPLQIRPAPPAPSPEPAPALPRAQFDAAVRDVFRNWHRPDVLLTNPLSRLLQGSDPVANLRTAVTEAVIRLRDERNGYKPYQAIVATFFDGRPKQETVAQQLGLPFSTYRRHLTQGVDRVCELLRHEGLWPTISSRAAPATGSAAERAAR